MPFSSLWKRISPQHQVPSQAVWLSVILAFVAMIYSGAYSVVTAISVIGFYLSYIIPVFLGWRKKSLWTAKRGPWHLGARSNMINGMACAWTLFICVIMMMPPNQRAGLGIALVMGALYIVHQLPGRHEIRKPRWALARESPASSERTAALTPPSSPPIKGDGGR